MASPVWSWTVRVKAFSLSQEAKRSPKPTPSRANAAGTPCSRPSRLIVLSGVVAASAERSTHDDSDRGQLRYTVHKTIRSIVGRRTNANILMARWSRTLRQEKLYVSCFEARPRHPLDSSQAFTFVHVFVAQSRGPHIQRSTPPPTVCDLCASGTRPSQLGSQTNRNAVLLLTYPMSSQSGTGGGGTPDTPTGVQGLHTDVWRGDGCGCRYTIPDTGYHPECDVLSTGTIDK